MAKKYVIRIKNQLTKVDKQLYRTYFGMQRKEKTLWEKDHRNGLFLYSNLDTPETTGEEVIPDRDSPSVEDMVEDRVMAEKLHRCIELLDAAEQELIDALYFHGVSERDYAEIIGITQKGINKRRAKTLAKLKKFIER